MRTCGVLPNSFSPLRRRHLLLLRLSWPVERRLPSLLHKIVGVVSDPINVTSLLLQSGKSETRQQQQETGQRVYYGPWAQVSTMAINSPSVISRDEDEKLE